MPGLAPARGIWMYLMGAAAVVVVILSWMVPEPPQQPGLEHRVEPIAYTACADQAPPNYGTRALSNSLEGGCTR